jgi:hypothetical protein
MNTILPEAPDGTSDQVSTKAGEVQIAPKIEAQLGPAAPKSPRIRTRLARQLGQLQARPERRVANAQLRPINAIEKEPRELFSELTELITKHLRNCSSSARSGP